MEFLGRNPHLLAEKLAQFTSHQAVVGPDGTGLRTAPAKVAPVGKLDQPGYERPVQLDIAMLPGRKQAATFDVLEVEATHDFGTKCGTVELVPATGLKYVTGIRAGLALRTVLHRQHERLQECPVVFTFEQLLQPRKEFPDQFLLFLPGLGLGEIDNTSVIQKALTALNDLRGKRRQTVLIQGTIQRGWQRH